MRSKCGVYVDAGYLLASAATRITGTSLRNGIAVDFPKLIMSLVDAAAGLSELPVLRVHWYDAAHDAIPNAEQAAIGMLPKVKLRLGRFGYEGQQKGVDLRMGLDLVAHARNDAVDTIVLVSGDDDLTEAVEEAQGHGVQVILLSIPSADGRPHGVSKHLQLAADHLEILDASALEVAVQRSAARVHPPAPPRSETPRPNVPSPALMAGTIHNPPPPTVAYSGATGMSSVIAPEYSRTDEEIAAAIDDVTAKALKSFLATATGDDLVAFRAGRPSIPRDLDRALLLDLSDSLSIYTLSDDIRTKLRRQFWEAVDAHDS